MSPCIYIIVLNYCSLEDSLACIASLRQQDYRNYRLLVLDNASPDGSGAVLCNSLSAAEFRQLPTNTGYAGGNNIGLRMALAGGAEYVLILNPDVRVSSDCVGACVQLMEKEPSIGALNPLQLNKDGTALDAKFREGIFVRHGYDAPQPPFEENRMWDTEALYGAALLVRREVLLSVGGFDPLFFAYGEEDDLCRRMRGHGVRLVVTSKIQVHHLRTKEQSFSDFLLFLRLKGQYLYRLKDPGCEFQTAIHRVSRNIARDLRKPPTDQYPFKYFPIRRKHILRCALWLLLRLPIIYRHRALDRSAAYLAGS